MKPSSSEGGPGTAPNGGESPRKKWSFRSTQEVPQSADWLVLVVVVALTIAAVVIIPPENREGTPANSKSGPPAKATGTGTSTNLNAIAASHDAASKAAN